MGLRRREDLDLLGKDVDFELCPIPCTLRHLFPAVLKPVNLVFIYFHSISFRESCFPCLMVLNTIII
jgi:hypothetical protein